MDPLMIALIIIGITIPLILIGWLTYTLLDNRTIIRFIMPDKSIMQIKVKRIVDGFSIQEKKYLFDHRAVIFNRMRKRILYYHWNNPNPIIWTNTGKHEISSQDLYTLLETKLIKDLFSSTEINMLKILLYVSIGLSLITLLVVFLYNPQSAVTLENNEANRLIIDEVVRQILGR
jgi:hypothetical protein